MPVSHLYGLSISMYVFFFALISVRGYFSSIPIDFRHILFEHPKITLLLYVQEVVTDLCSNLLYKIGIGLLLLGHTV